MTRSHRLSGPVACLGLAMAALLGGCAASKPQSFTLSFLPAAPAHPAEESVGQPPPVSPSHYVNEMPQLAPRMPTPASVEVESRLKTADARFEAGKRAYQQGDFDFARREFNRSLDVLLGAPEGLAERTRLERKLDELTDKIYRYDLEGLGSGEARDEVVYDKSPLDGMLEMTFPTDPKLKPQVKEELQATVSQLPLEENDTVLGYIHFFSTDRGRRTLISGLKRAGRYRPLIQRILDEEGVPQELIYLAQAESGFLPRAISYKQATGMWQFVQWRGREYGLNQTTMSDDRLDPEKATRAAARHLHDLYTEFGDWYLAMAAYNCGPGCVEAAVRRTGFADFWELRNRNALPQQTMNYVPLIVAITIMAKNAKDYGLDGLELERPVEYDTVEAPASTSLQLIADAIDRPVSEIADLNPALIRAIAPAGYQLHVPKGTSRTLLAALENIPAERRANWRMHRVETGETLAAIAKRYNTPATLIAAANHYSVEAPESGDLMVIPAAFERERSAASGRRTRLSVKTASRGRVNAKTVRYARAGNATLSARVLHQRATSRKYKMASNAKAQRAQ